MRKIVKALENIGQTSSIKQYTCMKEMQNKVGIKEKMLNDIEKLQADLVCLIEPGDDE